jgi:hypothetical protein
MRHVTIWKKPCAPGDVPTGTLPLERVAAMVGLAPTWLTFVLLNSDRATGVWDTADWHIEAAEGQNRKAA